MSENTLEKDDLVKVIADQGSAITRLQSELLLLKQGFGGVGGGGGSMGSQALINGNFDIWQRGVTVTVNDLTTTYLADHWRDYIDKDTGTLPTIRTRLRAALTAGDIPNTFYFTRLSVNGAGSGYNINARHLFAQVIEQGTRFLCGAGKQLHLSFYARASQSGKRLGVYTQQYYGSGGSPTGTEVINGTYFNLTSEWQKFTYVIDTNTLVGKTFGTNNDDSFHLIFMHMWGSNLASLVGAPSAETYVASGDIDMTRVKLSIGNQETDFPVKSRAQELADCQRYYEKSYQYGVYPAATITAGNDTEAMNVGTNTTNRLTVARRFRVPKAISPTLTVYDWAGASGKISELNTSDTNTDGISPSYTHADPSGFYVSHSPSTKAGIAFAWTAEAEI